MKSSKFVLLAVLSGALVATGCKGGTPEGAEGSGHAAPHGEGSAAAPAEASEPAAPAEASEPAAPTEGSGAATQPTAEGSGLPTSDFVATAAALHGAWDADFQGMMASQQMTEEERQLAAAMLGSATMTLTFGADGTMQMAGTMMGQAQNQSGTWTLVSAEANKLNISTTVTKEGAEPETQAMVVAFRTADALVMSDGGAQTIPFNRKVEGAAEGSAAAPAAVAPAGH